MNVRFDDIELSTLGLQVLGHNSRQMAPFQGDTVRILGRSRMADLGGEYNPTSTSLDCNLTADTDDWTKFTKAEWLKRLDQVKKAISPRKGYRKLVLVDQQDRYRWCRYQQMGLTEDRQWKKRPFMACTLEFDNLESHWRQPEDPVIVLPGTLPATIPNTGDEDTRPVITVQVIDTIRAMSDGLDTAVTLLTIDDLNVGWSGSFGNELNPGDVIRIDSETLTMTRKVAGTGPWRDVVRFYNYSGAGAYDSDGFPEIKVDGSTVTYLHPRLSEITVEYDSLHP